MNKSIFIVFIMLLIIFQSYISMASPIYVNVTGPTYVGTNTTETYTIYVNGYFYKYGYHLFLTGENLSGLKQVEYTGMSSKGVFKVNITFPATPQVVELAVMGIGYYENSSTPYTQIYYYKINVVKSIPFTVRIYNPSSLIIKNVTLSYYLNGNFIGNQTVSSINPGQYENITYYYVGTLNQGTNSLVVKINSSVLKFSNYSNVYTMNFYYGSPPNYSWAWYLFAVVVVIVVFLILMAEFSRRKPRPKWKK